MNKIENIQICILLLIFFLPALLITGPFLPDLLVTSCALGYLIVFRNSFFLDLKLKLVKLFFLYYFIICLSSIFSESFYFSIKTSITYIRFIFFSLFLLHLLKKIRKNYENYLLILVIFIYGLLFFDSIFQLSFGHNIVGLKYINESNFRITSFFGKDEVLGSYTARLFPFLIFLIFNNCNNQNKKYYLYFSILSALTICILSGERTSLFLYLISFGCFAIFLNDNRKYFLRSIFFSIIIFVLAFSLEPRIKNRMVNQTLEQIGLKDDKKIRVFSETYEGHYKIALKMFIEKPLLGQGTKMFRKYCAKKENFIQDHACTTHPHNIYIQALSENGLAGFLIIFLLYLYLLYLLLKSFYFRVFRKNQIFSDQFLALIVFYVSNFFPLAPSGNFFNNWLCIIYFFPLGFLLHYIVKNKKNCFIN